MCGVCGIVSSDVFDSDLVRVMNNVAAHRGPDGEGYWAWAGRGIGEFANGRLPGLKKSRAVLGHRRLAILDLSEAGAQPMSYGDGSIWISFNGEVYNFLELKAELASLGHKFHTGTDTEVILAAYTQWDTDCFYRFNGMWGMAIVDLRKRVVVFSRDRMGIKPLYLWNGNQTLAFASEIKQLLTLSSVSSRLNIESIIQFVETGYEYPERTFFRDIIPCPAGHYGIARLDDPRVPKWERYWCPEAVALDVSATSPSEQLRMLFQDSIRLRMRSDVPVGVSLSGGLDSTAVHGSVQAMKAQSNSIQATHTFSAAFEDPRFDERAFVRVALKAFGGQAHFTFPKPEDFIDELELYLWYQDEPPPWFSQYAAFRVMRLARENSVPVILNGQGGDELFTGYWSAVYVYLGHLMKKSPTKVITHLMSSLLPGGNAEMIAQIFPHFRQYVHRKKRLGLSLLRNDFRNATKGSEINWATTVHNMSQSDYKAHELFRIHLPRLLKWDDRNSMASGIEGRYPFLDHRIVEFAIQTDTSHNVKRGWNKYLVRESLKDYLPPKIRWRKDKAGFTTPQSEWVRTHLRPVLETWSVNPGEILREFVDRARLRELTKRLIESHAINRKDENQIHVLKLYLLDRWIKVSGATL